MKKCPPLKKIIVSKSFKCAQREIHHFQIVLYMTKTSFEESAPTSVTHLMKCELKDLLYKQCDEKRRITTIEGNSKMQGKAGQKTLSMKAPGL